jgi:hypothetical protein
MEAVAAREVLQRQNHFMIEESVHSRGTQFEPSLKCHFMPFMFLDGAIPDWIDRLLILYGVMKIGDVFL